MIEMRTKINRSRFVTDTIQLVLKSLGHLSDGGREGRHLHGVHSIKGSQEQIAEA